MRECMFKSTCYSNHKNMRQQFNHDLGYALKLMDTEYDACAPHNCLYVIFRVNR